MAQKTDTGLYPKIEEPYNTGFLYAGGHKIYFEECGNPKGQPLLFVHGGPGAGCSADDRRYADPDKYRIILFDQRGCGRSRPLAKTEHNTTWDLVRDMRYLLTRLDIQEKVLLFGGSWGSTLPLVYSIKYPETVAGMILRGIWLADQAAFGSYLPTQAPHPYFPEVWERLMARLLPIERKNPARYYYRRMTAELPEERKRLAYEWNRYECAIVHLQEKSEEELDKEIRSFEYEACAIIESYYIMNNCFLEEGYILKNVYRIPMVPISIVQGRYDAACQVLGAYQLAKALPQAKLHIVLAGHSRSEPEITKKLVEETDRMSYLLKP